jgi:hypothetical protein
MKQLVIKMTLFKIKIFHDPILTAALLDRITHRALVMNMNGTSFRQR